MEAFSAGYKRFDCVVEGQFKPGETIPGGDITPVRRCDAQRRSFRDEEMFVPRYEVCQFYRGGLWEANTCNKS